MVTAGHQGTRKSTLQRESEVISGRRGGSASPFEYDKTGER